MLPWVNCKNSTSLAYLTLSGKYSERNFLLKTSQVIGSYLSSMMDFALIHQCSTSPVSMYTAKVNLLSLGHILASNILSMSFSHWSVTSGLVFSLNFTRWCFRKCSGLHSRWRGLGSGPWTGVAALFSSNWRRVSMCYLWASSIVNLAASIYYITNCCCSKDVVWRCIDASYCCIILVLCWVKAAIISSIAQTISGASPWED